MELDPKRIDNQTLRALYDRHLQELSEALLAGAEWKDVQDKRKLLIEISKLLHSSRGTQNPAENVNRQ